MRTAAGFRHQSERLADQARVRFLLSEVGMAILVLVAMAAAWIA